MAERKPSKKGLVIQTLVVKPNNRNVTDIDTWRNALKAADKGKREKLYDLYADLLLDNILSSAIDKRVMAITNADIAFMRNDENVPEMDTFIDSPEFEDIIKEIVMSVFWGKTVLELDFSGETAKPYSIPRKNIRPDLGLIVVNSTDESGTPYRADDFFLEAGKDDDLGLILKAAPFCIYKRGGFGDYAQFIELFGMPQRIGKYNSNDDATRKILEQVLDQAGSAAWAVIPKEADVETNSPTITTGVGLYIDFIKACNEEILIGILGQTMTTQNGSSKSQSETHKEGEEGINKSDRRFVQRILNKELLPRLEKRGYPVSGGFFYFPEAGENLTTTERLAIDVQLKCDIGLPIDDEYFYETYGIPKPTGTVTKKEPDKPAKEVNQSSPNEQQATINDQPFWERLFSFFVLAPEKGASLANNQIQLCQTCGGTHQLNNELKLSFSSDDFDELAFLKRIASGESSYFDAELFTYTSSIIKQGLNSGFIKKSFASIEYGFEPDALKTAMEMNIFHFGAAKNLVEVQKLNELFRSSKNFDEFRTKAQSVTNIFNKTWLQTEYETAYLTAESSAEYYRLMGQTELFPYWEYVTVGDSKVRPEHRSLSGLILPANDNLWDRIYPPNGWKCRCHINPRMKNEVDKSIFEDNRKQVNEYFNTKEWKINDAQGFGVNRAKLGYVFSENQMYIKKFPQMASKKLENLYCNSWNLDEITKRIAKATEDIPVYKGSAEDWYKSNSKLTDYNQRSIKLEEKNFKFHTTKKKIDRVELLDAMNDALINPDEVWLNDYLGKFDNFISIKYYKGKAIALVSKISKGKVYEVDSWFEIELNSKVKKKIDNPKWKYRRGLLVFNKK